MSALKRDLPVCGLDAFTSETASPLTPPPPVNWSGVLGNPLEANLGRAAAVCIHPAAAWRLLPTPWRWVMVAAYAAVAYAVTLGTLLLRGLA